MILSIAAISDPDTLADIGRRLETLGWRDGRATAGAQAAKVKRNEQAVMTSEEGRALGNILRPLIADNPVVNAAARPRRFSALTISRTADTGHYGAHIDNALMGSGSARMRTDLSFTLFLGSGTRRPYAPRPRCAARRANWCSTLRPACTKCDRLRAANGSCASAGSKA